MSFLKNQAGNIIPVVLKGQWTIVYDTCFCCALTEWQRHFLNHRLLTQNQKQAMASNKSHLLTPKVATKVSTMYTWIHVIKFRKGEVEEATSTADDESLGSQGRRHIVKHENKIFVF